MDHPIIFFLAVIGALYLGKEAYIALLEWKKEAKDNPLHLDQNTLDQIKLEKEGSYVGWKSGVPVVLHPQSHILPKEKSGKRIYKSSPKTSDEDLFMERFPEYLDYEQLAEAVELDIPLSREQKNRLNGLSKKFNLPNPLKKKKQK